MAGYIPPTPDQIRGVIHDADPDEEFDEQIKAAGMLIAARCQSLAYTGDELTILATWLAAHFYEVDRSRAASEAAGQASENIVTQSSLGLNLTHPGQQVMLLDYLGGLVGLGYLRKRVKATWLGRTREERREKPLNTQTWPTL